MASMKGYTKAINLVTINLGGSEHNPFEYYPYESIDNINDEWNYRKTLSGLTINTLKGYLKDLDKKYLPFKKYLDSFANIDILEYFFPVLYNIEHTKKILELDNKFGRRDSNIKRFNPIEFGYDPVYFMTDGRTQYIYIKECALKGLPIEELLKKCLEVPFLNKSFSLENTKWLSKDYDVENVYNIILYDMMKTYAVYTNYKLFDKIYTSKNNDIRLIRLLGYLKNEPSIIVTQEGKFTNKYENLKLVHNNTSEGGVAVYTYNLDVSYRSSNLPNIVNRMFGNNKASDVEFIIDKKILRLVGVHCKEPKGDRNYNSVINLGVKKLFESRTGLISYFRNIYDWYFDIDEKIDVVLGDFNPKDNSKVNAIREYLGYDYNVYPENNEYTTKKIRSGYCAQFDKFWKKSLVCKDLLIVKNDTYISKSEVFPKYTELLTDKWLGDHSSLITKIKI